MRSEKIRTTELALEHAPTSVSRMLVTVFRSDMSDLLALATDARVPDRLTFLNAQAVRVRGMEAEMERRWSGGARLRVAYGWQKAQASGDAAEPLANAPRHLLKLQWSDTLALATRLTSWQLGGDDVALVIGGPDGLEPEFRQAAHERIRLSDLTLPHAMARVLLIEQLYRAWSINANHPYHRE